MKHLNCFLLLFIVWAQYALSEVPSIADFNKDADLISSKISPDGRYMAQLWNKDSARIVLVKDLLTEGQPIIGRISDTITRTQSISWTNNQRLLLTIWVPLEIETTMVRSKDKDFDIDDYVEFSRIVSTDVKLENGVVLMGDQRRTTSNTNLSNARLIAKDPNHLLMTAFTGTWLALFKVDPILGTSSQIIHGSSFTFGFLVDDLGTPMYRADYMPVAKEIIFFKPIGEGQWEEAGKVPYSVADEERSPDDKELIALDHQDLIFKKKNEISGFYELIRYKSSDKTTEVFASEPNADIISPITENGSENIVGYRIDGDHARDKYFDPKRQEHYDQLIKKLGDYDFHITSQTADLAKAVVNVSGADNPSSFYNFNFDKNELELINYGHKGLKPSQLGTAAVANYLTRDNIKIHAYLLFPPGYIAGNKYPLVVLPHGGPNFRDTANYDNFAQFLATRGYLVIKPNFRGSTGYGEEFEKAGYKQWGQLMQDDVDDAAQFMIRKGFADPNRICIAGISYGGYSALMGAVKRPDLYKCAVSINGVTHLREMISQDEETITAPALREKYLFSRRGDPRLESKMLDENSPALQTAKISIPVLIFGSKKDKKVPLDQAQIFTKAMQKSKGDVKLVTLDNSGHNPFANKKDAKTLYQEVETFLAKYLKIEEKKEK